MKNNNTFTRKELATLLNNALVACKNHSSGPIPDKRLGRLMEFAQAESNFIEKEFITNENPDLRPEEAVYVMVAMALKIHLAHVIGKHEVPVGAISDETIKSLKALLEN